MWIKLIYNRTWVFMPILHSVVGTPLTMPATASKKEEKRIPRAWGAAEWRPVVKGEAIAL